VVLLLDMSHPVMADPAAPPAQTRESGFPGAAIKAAGGEHYAGI